MIQTIKYYLLFILFTLPFTSSSQSILDFKILIHGINAQFEIKDTIVAADQNLIDIEYKTEANKSYCQQLIYSSGMKSLFGFDPETETSFYYEVDSLDRIMLFSTKTNIKLVSYTFYPSGKLESYSIQEEDTLFNNHNSFSRFRLTSNSFTLSYHENGNTISIIYFTPGDQSLTIYWPNKSKKIVADYDANRYSYCGKYLEYDEVGNLLIKGRYYLSDDPLTFPVKIGVWKYFEGGKLIKKEKHKHKIL